MSHPNLPIEQAAGESPSRKPPFAGWRRDAVMCLSLANLWFLPEWEDIFSYHRIVAIWDLRNSIPTPADDAALMIAVLLLAAMMYAGARLSRRLLPGRGFCLARLAWLGMAGVPLWGQREAVGAWRIGLQTVLQRWIGPWTAWSLAALCGAAVLWLVWKYQRPLAAVVSVILVMLSPFCLLTFGEAAWAMATYRGQPSRDGSLAPRLAAAPPPVRVVWIIFDEWDYRLTFVDRPARLAMPEIDRLRGESLFATHARSPFMDTFRSLPSLIAGRPLEATVDPTGSSMSVAPAAHPEAKPVPWDEKLTVFSAVRQSGLNVGLVGWYFPYCRIMNGALAECAWWAAPNEFNGIGDSFLAGFMGTGVLGKAGGYSIGLLERLHCHYGQYSTTRYKARMYAGFMAESTKQVTDPSLGLVFLHVPVPHYPNPYNRFTGRMDGGDDLAAGYVDSLALLDRMMGELRAAMESRGTWDRTVLLLSADHPYRKSRDLDGKFDRRVPFLLHFPGQPATAEFTPDFDTIVSANLVSAILRGSVSTPAEASQWIERRSAGRDSPILTDTVPRPGAGARKHGD